MDYTRKTIKFFVLLIISINTNAIDWETSKSIEFKDVHLFKNINTSENLKNEASILGNFKSKKEFSNKSLNLDFEAEQSLNLSQNRNYINKSFYNVNELNLKINNQITTIVGFHKVNWEGTDFLNPMEISFSKNLDNPLNAKNNSELGLFVNYDGFINVDLLYIPHAQNSVLPLKNSAWWPRKYQLPTADNQTKILLPENVNYQIDSTKQNDNSAEQNWGIKIQKNWKYFDLSLGHSEGQNPTPYLGLSLNATTIATSPELILQIISPVQIRPEMFRIQKDSGLFTWVNDEFIFKYSFSNIKRIGDFTKSFNEQTLNIIELEKTFYINNKLLHIILESVTAKEGNNSGISLISDIYKKSLITAFRFEINENWVWSSALFQEQTHFSTLSFNSLTWKIKDGLSSTATVQNFEGTQNSPFGLLKEASSIQISFKYEN